MNDSCPPKQVPKKLVACPKNAFRKQEAPGRKLPLREEGRHGGSVDSKIFPLGRAQQRTTGAQRKHGGGATEAQRRHSGSTAELSGAQRSSAELSGAQREHNVGTAEAQRRHSGGTTEAQRKLSGAQRSSADLSGAQRSSTELNRAQRSSRGGSTELSGGSAELTGGSAEHNGGSAELNGAQRSTATETGHNGAQQRHRRNMAEKHQKHCGIDGSK